MDSFIINLSCPSTDWAYDSSLSCYQSPQLPRFVISLFVGTAFLMLVFRATRVAHDLERIKSSANPLDWTEDLPAHVRIHTHHMLPTHTASAVADLMLLFAKLVFLCMDNWAYNSPNAQVIVQFVGGVLLVVVPLLKPPYFSKFCVSLRTGLDCAVLYLYMCALIVRYNNQHSLMAQLLPLSIVALFVGFQLPLWLWYCSPKLYHLRSPFRGRSGRERDWRVYFMPADLIRSSPALREMLP